MTCSRSASASPKQVKVENNSVDVSKACEVLAAWDRKQDVTSRGAQVWTEFWPTVDDDTEPLGRAVRCEGSGAHAARDQCRRRESSQGSDAGACAAAQKLEDAQIPLDAPWGDVQYTERNGEKIGIPGGSHATGMFSVMAAKLTPGKGYTPIISGNSWMQVVTWTDAGEVDARGILVVFAVGGRGFAVCGGSDEAVFQRGG